MRSAASRYSGFLSEILLLGWCTVIAGCGRHTPAAEPPQPPLPAPPAQVAAQVVRPVPPSGAAQPAVGQVPHIMVFGGPLPGVTVTQAPPEPEVEPEPTVGYASLAVACDSVEALMRRRLHVAVGRRDSVPVDFGFGGPSRPGCELKASGKRNSPDSASAPVQTTSEDGNLADGLQQAGWANLLHYQADGPDGEAEGWRSRESTCVVRWSWDGGDDSDSTNVASDEWDLEVGCTPWAPEDSRRE